MPSKYASLGGIAVHYLHSGPTTLPTAGPPLDHGPVLLFIHGEGGNAGVWRRSLAQLGETALVIAFDFPGHGRSGNTEGLASIEAYRDFTVSFIAALELPALVAVGTSMGAAVALELAATLPQQVRALVLLAAAPRLAWPQQQIDLWGEVMRGRVPQPFSTEGFSPSSDFAVMREVWTEQVKTDPRVRHGDLRAGAAYDARPRLGAVRQPTLIISGADDPIASAAAAAELRDGIGGARLVVLEGAGHHLPMEKAAETGAALEEFLRQTGVAP